MVEVVVLGSGTPNPTPDRAGSALAVVDGDDWVLVDCGRAATQRALQAGLDLTTLTAVLLTHHHTDHISDLPTLATTRWTAGAAQPLLVVAPAGPCAVYSRRCLDVFVDQSFHSQAEPAAGLRPSLRVEAFEPAVTAAPIPSVGGWAIAAALVDHHPMEAAVGYRIERAGTVVAVSGDTAVCDGMRSLARDADVLVHEALLTARSRPAALAWNAGTDTVGAMAAEVGVARLVLTHLLPAPSDEQDEAAYVAEARSGGYRGPVEIARDLLRIYVGSDGGRRSVT